MSEEIERKIKSGELVDENDFSSIMAQQEYIEDLADQVEGQSLGIRSFDFPFRSESGGGFAIIVGHTARSPGALGVSPINQNEYPWNQELAQLVQSICRTNSVECRIFYRDGLGIEGAYQQVLTWGATIAAEFHFNAFNGSAHGTETLYDAQTNSGSVHWAERLQDGMLSALGLRDRGLKELSPGDRGYRSVSAIDIPTALIEPFFGDNPTEARIAHARKSDLAEALATAATMQLSGV